MFRDTVNLSKILLLDISLHSGLGLLIWPPCKMTLVDNYVLQDKYHQRQGPLHSGAIRIEQEN